MPIKRSVSIHCSNHSVFILKSIIGFHKSECNITGLFFSRITTGIPKECHNMHPAHYDTLLANQDTNRITVEISTFHRKFYLFLSESLLSPRKFYFLLIAVLGRRLIIFGSKFPVEIRPVRNADFIDNFLYAQISRHQ